MRYDNKPRLLTQWLSPFDVHDVNWLSIQLSWNSIHTDTDCGFLPVETAGGDHCDFSVCCSCIFPLILICCGQAYTISHTIWIETQNLCAVWAEPRILCLSCIICKMSKKVPLSKQLCTSLFFFVSCSHSVTASENVRLVKIKGGNRRCTSVESFQSGLELKPLFIRTGLHQSGTLSSIELKQFIDL